MTLCVDWMQGIPAPDAVMEMIAYQCKQEYKPDSCICINKVLKCMPMCKLQNWDDKKYAAAEQIKLVDIDYDF